MDYLPLRTNIDTGSTQISMDNQELAIWKSSQEMKRIIKMYICYFIQSKWRWWKNSYWMTHTDACSWGNISKGVIQGSITIYSICSNYNYMLLKSKWQWTNTILNVSWNLNEVSQSVIHLRIVCWALNRQCRWHEISRTGLLSRLYQEKQDNNTNITLRLCGEKKKSLSSQLDLICSSTL